MRRKPVLVVSLIVLAFLSGLLIARWSGCWRARRPNIILIAVDTLRADHLSCYGYDKIRTPNIDNLARKGVLLENATSHVPLTLPSFSCIMTSTLPPTNGVHYNEGFHLDDSAETLAEILRDEGYATAAVVGAVVLDSVNGVSQGFSRYDDNFGRFTAYLPQIKTLEDQLSFTQRRAAEVTDLALDVAASEAEDRPFFLFFHYFDPHAPYDPPPPYSLVDPNLEEGSQEIALQRYDGEVAYTDEQIGRLLRNLEMDGLLENTLVVLVADHGDGLGDNGEKTHGYYIYNGTMHIPVIFSMPGTIPEGEVYKGLAGHIDVAPTILDIAGIEGRGERFQGRSLFPFDDDRTPVYEYMESATTFVVFKWGALRGVRSKEWKYISAPQEELYNLADDPGEKENLIDQAPQMADSLREMMRDMLADMEIYSDERGGNSFSTLSDEKRSPEFEKKLQALGYIGTPKNLEAGYEDMFAPSLADPKDKRDEYRLAMLSNLGMRLGIAFTAMDSLDRAEKYLRSAIEQYPRNSNAFFYLGLIDAERGNYDAAREKMERVLDIEPDNVRAEIATADFTLATGDSAAAVRWLESAFSVGIDTERELVLAGRLCKRLGMMERAVESMRRALVIDPEDDEARLSLAEFYLSWGSFEEACPQLDSLLEKQDLADSLVARVCYGVGRCLYTSGDPDSARGMFLRVVALDSSAADAYNQLGLSDDEIGEYQRAIEEYTHALRLNPDLHDVYSNLGVTYYKMGRYRESREEFERYLPYAEDEAEATRLKAFIEEIRKKEISGG